jgi:hypothetical protein
MKINKDIVGMVLGVLISKLIDKVLGGKHDGPEHGT